MNEERELKFRLDISLEEVKSRLVEQGAEVEVAAAEEKNWVFDRAGELASSARLLRLRTDAQGCRVTFKGAPRYEEQTKVREELEFTASDAQVTRLLLERLGYSVVKRYEKVREEWHLGASVVCLDHTPIGDFVEFEGNDAAEQARRCGFEPATAERRSYLALYEDYRASHPEAPADMVF
jgi:predicted adenylyl cyclase CyaB